MLGLISSHLKHSTSESSKARDNKEHKATCKGQPEYMLSPEAN